MRLNQYVASCTRLSRRSADLAIEEGRVRVGDSPGRIGQLIDDEAKVFLDEELLVPPAIKRYVLYHKPAGAVVSRVRQGEAPTIYELLGEAYIALNPVGRLDKDSSGLLVLSDDGAFIQRASHPSYGKLKVYELVLDRPVTARDLGFLRAGVLLEDGPSLVSVMASDGPRLTLGLTEGRNRQLRRTASALGYSVVRLHRIAFGALELGTLPIGETVVLEGEPSL